MRKLKTLMGKISGIRRNNIKKGVAGFAIALSAFCLSTLSCYAVEGKVTAETAKIRAQTSTDSEVVGSTQRGKTIDILEAVKDSSGSVWYKVAVAGGGYGYIRSDLVETSQTIEPTSQASASQSGSAASAPAETTPTSIGEQPATITSSKNANIRSGASTQHSTVATLPNGTAVTLIGEANDSSGNKWYQISCTYNDKAVEGYVRSDLISLGAEVTGGEGAEGENPEGVEGENPEGTEGENPEGAEGEGGEGTEPSEPAPEEHNDYEIVYTQNDTGEYEYYLYNNVDGTRQKLNELLSAISYANQSNQELQDQVDKGKIIIIVLAVVIVILFIVLTVLLFKIRSLYYGDYDEDDEEEEEEEEEPEPEPEPVKRKRRRRIQEDEEDEEEEEPPVRKKRPRPQDVEEKPARSQERAGQPRTKGGEKELRALENREPAKRQPTRKPQNFLVDDDEFEFEFLNMDDKDL